MIEPPEPLTPLNPERRRRERRAAERREPETSQMTAIPLTLPVVVEPAPPEPAEPTDPATAFAAQLLGQPGQKRGLRGGPETLERARGAYLDAQWRGRRDRRIPRGKAARTEA